MKVTLISYTPHALDLLLFTKQTRLRLSIGGMKEIEDWTPARKTEELTYMLNTIQSSWEFVDYTFLIEEVTRAFTHQLVRHRVGVSFAQQAQRAVDMTGFNYTTGPTIRANPKAEIAYDQTMEAININYQRLIQLNIPAQDARGILPTNIHTNIIMKANLRSLHDMMGKRLCVKAQGEAQDVFRLIRDRVIEIHPWADPFLRVWCATHGTCCFPSFPVANCPVKPFVYNPETQTSYSREPPSTLATIQSRWLLNRAEAQPDVPKELLCPDCEEARKMANADLTTPGFFFSQCERHRVQGHWTTGLEQL